MSEPLFQADTFSAAVDQNVILDALKKDKSKGSTEEWPVLKHIRMISLTSWDWRAKSSCTLLKALPQKTEDIHFQNGETRNLRQHSR